MVLGILLGLSYYVCWAGNGGPDTDGYRWIDSNEPGGPPFSWVEISPRAGGSGTLIAQGDDKNSGLLPILPSGGFSYRGSVYTTLAVCSNGWLSFTEGVDSSYSGRVPDSLPPNNVIAPLWTDLIPIGGSYGSVYYLQDTLAGENRTIVEWDSVAGFNSTTYYKFEVILNAPSTAILYQYKYSGNWTGTAASVGIEDTIGKIGLSVGQSNLANQYALKFYTDIPYNVGIARIVRPNDIELPMTTLVPNAWVKNFGTATDTFPVFCRIDSSATQIYFSQRQVSGLRPGDTLLVKFDFWTVGPDSNTYNVSFYTALPGDPDPTNDTLKVDVLSSQGQRGWLPATNLGDSINTAYGEFSPSLTGDENHLFFSSDRPGGFGQGDLLESNKLGGVWQKPVNLGDSINTSYLEGDPWISADGNLLVFSSDRPGGQGTGDLWMAKKVNSVWQKSFNMGNVINGTYDDLCAWMSADTLRLYFTSSRPGGYGSWDIWMSKKDGGQWQTPWNLGPIINTPVSDAAAFLSNNENTLYYESGADLWTSQNVGGQWQPKVNLGSDINSSSREDRPCLSYSGASLFFASDRLGGKGSWDLYKSEQGISGNESGTNPFVQKKGGFVLGLPNPNPSRENVGFSLELPSKSMVEACIFSISGSKIKTLVNGSLSAGIHKFVWDTRTERGTEVGAGTYFLQVSAGGEEAVRKVIVLK